MEGLLELMKKFEQRNNISVSLDLFSDGSGDLLEFWDEECIKAFSSLPELYHFLESGKLEMKDGHSTKPIKIVD